jgi:hypothetical protein
MSNKKRNLRPSPALIIACLALFVALGGVSVAALKLKANSVKTKNIKNGAVTTPKLAADAKAPDAAKLGGLVPDTYKTASNYTQDATDNPITGTTETIGSPIQITTTGTKRVIAMAAVHATNGVASTGAYLVCQIKVDATAGVFDTDYASPAGGFTIVDAAVSPLASAVVGAGTHTVTLECSATGGGTPSMTVADASLAAWAVSA